MSLLTKIRTLRHARPAPEPELPDAAHAVAIIRDGNARWARRRGLPIAAGHRTGTKALRRTVEAAIDLGVESLAVYAFSTENWNRPPDEVELLMEIFTETIERELPDLVRQGVRTRFIGRRDRAPAALRERMAALESETSGNERLNLWIAFDYGGRAEIVDAANRAVAAGGEVDEETFATYLNAPDMPDPDLLIRTLRPVILAAYAGALLSLLGARLGGPEWTVAGFLITIVLAFILHWIADTRGSATVAIASTVLGAGWIGLCLGYLLLLRAIPTHGELAAYTVLLA